MKTRLLIIQKTVTTGPVEDLLATIDALKADNAAAKSMISDMQTRLLARKGIFIALDVMHRASELRIPLISRPTRRRAWSGHGTTASNAVRRIPVSGN